MLNQDEDKKSKLDLFEALFSEVGLTPAEDSHQLLETLVEARQEAFRGLYVGIRSGYLSQSKAAEIYTDLEALESSFRNELHLFEKDRGNAEKLQDRYSDIHQRLALLKSGDQQVGTKPRMPARLFQPLFENDRLQRCIVSCHTEQVDEKQRRQHLAVIFTSNAILT